MKKSKKSHRHRKGVASKKKILARKKRVVSRKEKTISPYDEKDTEPRFAFLASGLCGFY